MPSLEYHFTFRFIAKPAVGLYEDRLTARFILLLLAIFAFASAPSAMAEGAPTMPHKTAVAADGGHCPGAGGNQDAPGGAGG